MLPWLTALGDFVSISTREYATHYNAHLANRAVSVQVGGSYKPTHWDLVRAVDSTICYFSVKNGLVSRCKARTNGPATLYTFQAQLLSPAPHICLLWCDNTYADNQYLHLLQDIAATTNS